VDEEEWIESSEGFLYTLSASASLVPKEEEDTFWQTSSFWQGRKNAFDLLKFSE
jgi:hypothetical protein